jgi:hypothetical protein
MLLLADLDAFLQERRRRAATWIAWSRASECG